MRSVMMEMRRVTKRFGATTVLDDVTLDVAEGSCTAIMDHPALERPR